MRLISLFPVSGLVLSTGLLLALSTSSVHAQVITSISIPVGSQDGGCYPVWDNVYSISATPPTPLDVNSGIGWLVNPGTSNYPNFTLHDHVYTSPNVPDPARAVVTFTFDVPVIVSGLDIVQHGNGITRIEGFAGNTTNTLASIGSVFGPSGDVTGSVQFSEGQEQFFDFGNTTQSGTFFQFIVRKTSLNDGWANYRARPQFTAVNTVPEPGVMATGLILFGGLGIALFRSRR
jgi:hypothetical protein